MQEAVPARLVQVARAVRREFVRKRIAELPEVSCPEMAGAFYAQGVVYSAKQNQIAGTFVGNFFDMGTNVPNIYQVPGLSLNLPPNMPGDRNYYTIRVRTWCARA